MSPYKIALIAWFTLSALLAVGMIGKERKPTTPAMACIILVIEGGLIALVVLS
jgi:hypothetical protein